MFYSLVTQPRLQVKPEDVTRLRAKLFPPYRVVLFNDDYNDMDYVVTILLRLINHLTPTKAIEIMLIAHLKGSAIVVVCPKERAEYYQESLLSYGLTAIIEPD